MCVVLEGLRFLVLEKLIYTQMVYGTTVVVIYTERLSRRVGYICLDNVAAPHYCKESS